MMRLLLAAYLALFAAPLNAAGPVKAAAAPATAKAWSALLDAEVPRLQAQGGSRRLTETLGHLRFELALGRAQSLPRIAAHLAVKPEALAEMTAEARAKALSDALAAVRSELDAEAMTLLRRVREGGLDRIERERLRDAARLFYLMSPEIGQATRASAELLQLESVSAKARLMSLPLLGVGAAGIQRNLDQRQAVEAELDAIVAGAAAVRADRSAGGDARLERYLRRSLAAAVQRQESRGLDGTQLPLSLIEEHDAAFGGARPTLVRALRRSDDWRPIVAALTLAAAQTLGAADASRVAAFAAQPQARLPMPSWHPLAAEADTVADWLAARYGPAPSVKHEPQLKLFTLFGIPVGTDWMSLSVGAFVAYLFAGSGGLIGVLAFGALLYASITAHEFGHVLMARRFGIGTSHVWLNPLGGVAFLERDTRRPGEEFLVAVAGPLVNVALAGALYLLGPLLPAAAAAFAAKAMLLNLGIAIFNVILPAFPMDGGRIFRATLGFLLRDEYMAARITYRMARLVSPLMIVAGLVFQKYTLALIGLFVRMGSRQALRAGTRL